MITGAHDGTLRVWDDAGGVEGNPRCLYGFQGYKVWLGSVHTDGTRLVADGSDNQVLVHDFGCVVDDDDDEGEMYLVDDDDEIL